MKKLTICIVIFFIAAAGSLFSNGLLMPVDENYPKDFLYNRSTVVTVNINGSIAETVVQQEFVNEWTDSTDAVYSFPLPPDAKATNFLYWYENNIYKAVLKVKEQATNPGTGEGGVAALVNKYIGRNGIKIHLKGIKAGSVQRVELHYISKCDYYKGTFTYNFPLNTSDFYKIPTEHLQFNINVNSNSAISGYDIPSHNTFSTLHADDHNLKIRMVSSKVYQNKDFQFVYETDNSVLGADFYSCAGDSSDGHFALILRPQSEAPKDSVIPKRMIFLLSNSSNMTGYKLSQSVSSISYMIDQLDSNDLFNISIYNSTTGHWQTNPVSATALNRQNAKTYLEEITTSWGSDLNTALTECLGQISDENFNNAIIAFSDGYSPLDPKEIAGINTYNTGIFPVGTGNSISRERLEMTAALNYGFVTYIEEDDNIFNKFTRVFNQISQPVLKNVIVEFGQADPYNILPEKAPSVYAGSEFFITGRYQHPGSSALTMVGNSITGYKEYNFNLDFSSITDTNKFVESFWAKEKIDHLEREIGIYGETESLKDSLINLSLKYNIRCRYTAYIADYEDVYLDNVDDLENIIIPEDFSISNYPNPFNPSTTIRIAVNSDLYKVAQIRIYNSIGQLVRILYIRINGKGNYEVVWDGRLENGLTATSGMYIYSVQIGGKITSNKMLLLK